MRLFLLCITGSFLLSSCAIFQSPTPRSNAKVTNYSLVTDTRRDGRVKEQNSPASSIELPEVWTAGNVRLTSIEEWQDVSPDWAGAIEPPMKRREVQIERITDPSVAGDVAVVRAQRTAEVTSEVGTALLSATALSLLRYMDSMDVRQGERTERERIAVDRRVLELEERLRQAEEAAHHSPEPPAPEEREP